MTGALLSCAACLHRAARAVSRGGAVAEAAMRRSAMAPGQGSRRYATAAAAGPVGAPQALQAEPAESGAADAEAVKRKAAARLELAVKKQMAHMNADDPWAIAQYVEQALAKDRFDEALLLTQKASRAQQVVVAWNHLIDYWLQRQQLKKAMKLYNEMKKRAQLPNVKTFTIIFRGCAISQHPKVAVAEAVKHYNVLLNDKRLEPNSIHLNAVLNVCAKAGDLDSMFLIADTANDSARAPTAYTYTTILNALRHHGLNEMKGLPPEQQVANLQRIVDRAKGMWTEVIDKWKQGRLVIDEELVCAMGRVLLLAPKREDKREVLDLLLQTMNIPNLTKALVSDPFQDADMHNIAVSGLPKAVAKSRAVYAVPGRNTLALLLTALASSKQTTTGVKYWNLMVRHYGIVPDNDNWLRMFGMLKVAKASAHAAAILDIVPDEYVVDPKPYRIAMETCVRDNINPNAVEHSNKILDSMMSRLAVPDLHTLRLFLRVALVSHFQFRTQDQNGEGKAARRKYGAQIRTALSRLWEPYKKAHYHYFKATPRPANKGEEGVLYNDKREVIALARLMFSAFNKVINEAMLPKKELRQLRHIGAKINREIQSFYSNREELEPNLRPSPERPSAQEGEREEDNESEAMTTLRGDRQGGDFIWDTTKPSRVISRREKRLLMDSHPTETSPWRASLSR